MNLVIKGEQFAAEWKVKPVLQVIRRQWFFWDINACDVVKEYKGIFFSL